MLTFLIHSSNTNETTVSLPLLPTAGTPTLNLPSQISPLAKIGIKFINTCNNLSSEFLIKVGGEKVTLQLPSNNAVLLLAPLIFIIFLQGLYYHLYLFYKSGNQCKES